MPPPNGPWPVPHQPARWRRPRSPDSIRSRFATVKGRIETALIELRYRRIRVLPPIGKQKRYPALTLTVLYAQERNEPTDRPKIDGTLMTDLPVASHEAAVEQLHWYARRGKIETFHKVLKSGCGPRRRSSGRRNAWPS